MTSQLRRKPRITAPNTCQAITEALARRQRRTRAVSVARLCARAACCLAVIACTFSRGTADEAVSQPSGASKLKWRARATSAQRAAQPATESPYPARQASGQQQIAPRSTKSSRSRTRDSVMQVSSETDPLKDPFGDNPLAQRPSETQQAEDTQEPAATPDSQSEPSTLPSERGRSSEDTLGPPPGGTPFTLEPLPSESGGPAASGCDEYKTECLRAIRELQASDITKIYVGLVIEGTEGDDFPCDCRLGRDYAPAYAARSFEPTMFTWKATGVCHKPLYFEDVQLERYGHSWNPVVQPFMSGAHFFACVAFLPYNMGVNLPSECIYTLGYYRPGSCAPYVIEPIPWSLRGALFEAGAATGFGFMLWGR